jgi:tRNA threonylcarbamoyladenosine biosynthesis protein TsaE
MEIKFFTMTCTIRVEWGDNELVNILNSAGINTLTIDIEKISDDKREYKVTYA